MMPQTCPGSVISRCFLRLLRPRRGLIALLVGLALSVGVSLGAQAGTTWTVCASGCDYSSIKAAIAAPTTLDGDTRAIAAGTYTEPGIVVNKSLTRQGEAADTTIVQAAASCVAAGLVVQPGETLQMSVQGAAEQVDVREGLLAEYLFDEGAGRLAADSSGHHRHGRLEGDPQWVRGYYGHGLHFDGAHDYVYIGQQETLELTQYTLAAWVKTDGRTTDPERQEILEKAGAYWLNIRNDSHVLRAGGFFGGCQGSPYWTYLDTATSIPLHTWFHVASTYDGTTLRIFLNGVLSVSKAEARPPCTANHRLLILGAKKTAEDAPVEAFFSGILDEVRVYSRALSQAEIQAVMQVSRD
jgi:hypothetical protein